MAARAKTEFKDIPEDVRRMKLYPLLEAEDLFNVALTSKLDRALSKDSLEKSRIPALKKKKEQLKKLINQRTSDPVRRFERFYRDFPMLSVPPDMNAVNDQLELLGEQIKEFKAKRVPMEDLNITTREDWKQITRERLGRFFRGTREEMEDLLDREYDKFYAEQLAEAEDLFGEQTKDDIRQAEEKLKKKKEIERDKGCVASGKSGGGFWDNDDYIKWKKDYDEGNWGKKGYTGSGGWEQMLPFRHIFGLGKKSYREQERMGGGGNEPQSIEQYFKDKSYWAYPRQNPIMVLQGGADRASPPRSPNYPPPDYRPVSPDFPPPDYRPVSPDYPPPPSPPAAAADAAAPAAVEEEEEEDDDEEVQEQLKEVEKQLNKYETRNREGSFQVFKMSSSSDASIPNRLDFPTQVGFAFKPYTDGEIHIGIYFRGELVSEYFLEQDRHGYYDDAEKFVRKNPDFNRKHYTIVRKLFERLEESYLIPRLEERDDESALGEAEMSVINEGERFVGVSQYEDSDDNDFDDFPQRDDDYPRKGVQIVFQRNKRGSIQIGIYMNRKLAGEYIWNEGMTERKFVEKYSQDWSGMTELRDLVVKYKNLVYDADDAGRRAMFGDGKRRVGRGPSLTGVSDDKEIVEQELVEQDLAQQQLVQAQHQPQSSERFEQLLERANSLSENVLSNLTKKEARAVSGADEAFRNVVRNPAKKYHDFSTYIVYELVPYKHVNRIVYNKQDGEIEREKYRTIRYLDHKNNITDQGDLQRIPHKERNKFWWFMRKANTGESGKYRINPSEED